MKPACYASKVCQYEIDNMLHELLARCGLNRTEQAVLVMLVERGAENAARLAALGSLKRPTVYAALDNLIELGLVSKERRKAGTFFQSVSRDAIPRILEAHAKRRYSTVVHAVNELDSQLKALPARDRWTIGGFEFGTLESPDAVYIHLEEVLHRGDFSAIFDPQDIPRTQLEGVVKRFLIHTAATKPHIREIAVSGPATTWYRKNIRNPNHTVKEIRSKSILADVILVGGDVVTSIYEPGSELALRIREPHLYQTLMTMFDLLWGRL